MHGTPKTINLDTTDSIRENVLRIRKIYWTAKIDSVYKCGMHASMSTNVSGINIPENYQTEIRFLSLKLYRLCICILVFE